MRRKRSRKRGPLSLDEKLEALSCIFVDHESYAYVAKLFRTSQHVITHLVREVTNKPSILQELLNKRRQELEYREHIYDVVDEYNERDGVIDNVAQVKKLAE